MKHKKISVFESTISTSVQKTISIGEALDGFKNGLYRYVVDEIRGGNEESKKKLPMLAMHGLFNSFRKKTNFYQSSGLIIIDIDDTEDDPGDVRDDIFTSYEHILAVMVSPSGTGVKVLYYMNPDIVNAETYNQISKQVTQKFQLYGNVDYLSVTDCLIATYDPDIKINYEAEPDFIYVKQDYSKEEEELEPLDKSKKLWIDPEDFYETVLLNDIDSKTSNNYHFIQVSLLDLAKFGFKHPEEDLEFVLYYAEERKGGSKKNDERFRQAAAIAAKRPQTKWPYRLDSQFADEETDDYIDYSQYVDETPKAKKDKNKPDLKPNEVKHDTEQENEEETSFNGFIDYETIFEKIIEHVKQGDMVGAEISLKNFSEIFRFFGTGILTVTGIPSHGKTEFLDACILDLARLYQHETVVCGYEQTPAEHLTKLSRKLLNVNVTCKSWFGTPSNKKRFEKSIKFITDHIKHIDTTKVGGNINDVLKYAAEHIQKRRRAGGNPKYIVIDPFNMLTIKGKFSGHEKVEEILRRLTMFSHQMGVLVILVAHPFKMKKDEKTGLYEVPDFYSVKGSSAFYEMSYHGLVVYRKDQYGTGVMVRALKVKQNNLGRAGGEANFDYDINSGRYIPIDEEGNELSGDHLENDWLERALELINKNNAD